MFLFEIAKIVLDPLWRMTTESSPVIRRAAESAFLVAATGELDGDPSLGFGLVMGHVCVPIGCQAGSFKYRMVEVVEDYGVASCFVSYEVLTPAGAANAIRRPVPGPFYVGVGGMGASHVDLICEGATAVDVGEHIVVLGREPG